MSHTRTAEFIGTLADHPLMDALGDAVCGLDPSLRILWLNEVAAEVVAAFGIDATSLTGQSLSDTPLRDNEALFSAIQQAQETGTTATVVIQLPQGARRVRVRVVPFADGVALVGRERSDAQAMEQVHAEYEARYRTLFDSVPMPLVVYERESALILAVNQSMHSTFAGRGDLVGLPITAFLHRDELARFATGREVSGQTRGTRGTWRLRRSDDEVMEAEVTTFDLEFGGQAARIAMIRDLTESRRSDEERQLLRSAIACINDLLVITRAEPDADGRHSIVFVNEAFERHTGWSRAEAIGMPSTILDGPGTDPAIVARVRDHLRRGESIRAEVLHYTKEGREYWVELVIVPVYDLSGRHTHWVSVHRDISERKGLEEQLFQAQKMEAVGRLAGGVAHDFNNVLTAISGFSELLLEELPPGEGPHEEVLQIRAAAARATALTRQLLAFSRKQIMRPRAVNVGALVQEMERLLVRVTTEEVSIRLHIADFTPPVLADPVQLEQVLLNLAVNAGEAMPDGGSLTIEVSEIALGESYAHRHHGVRPGHYVCLVVSDSGIGMDRTTRERIFEPFFTTKAGGTGLGLSTVYGIVRQSGGHIWVYSEAGVGTTFKIYLPVSTGEVPELEVPAPAVEVLGGTETILVVEDEALVRDVTRAMLARRGYTVLVASDGEHALRVAAEYFGPIDILLTDVIMPRANGRRVAEQLRVVRPNIRVLYMSGYTEDAIVHHGVLDAGIVLLEKPFTERDLARTVREVLDAESLNR